MCLPHCLPVLESHSLTVTIMVFVWMAVFVIHIPDMVIIIMRWNNIYNHYTDFGWSCFSPLSVGRREYPSRWGGTGSFTPAISAAVCRKSQKAHCCLESVLGLTTPGYTIHIMDEWYWSQPVTCYLTHPSH